MTEQSFDQLTQQVHQWHGRRQMRDGLVWVPRGLLAGLMAAVLVAAAARLRPWLDNEQVGLTAVALGLVGLLVGLVGLLARRYSLIQQARFADRQFDLQERVSTAVEIQDGRLSLPPHIARQQFADTMTAVSRVDAKMQLPFWLNRQDWLMILVAVSLLVTAVLLPNPQENTLKKQRAITQAIEEQIHSLEAIKEEINQNDTLTEEQKNELAEPVENALQQLEAGNLSQEEAVAALSEAEADLRELSSNNSAEDLQRRLQDAGQPLADSPP
ncbi:MAG: hypothetical protein ACE5FD_15690, partial [Anaerolineae bacterium]